MSAELKKSLKICVIGAGMGGLASALALAKEGHELIYTPEGATDRELAHVQLDYIAETYGYPHMVGHRSSLAGGLYEGCRAEKAITFHFATSLLQVDAWSARARFTAQPRDGEPYTVEADVVLAADGIKSNARRDMLQALNIDAAIVDTNQAAYRIMITRDQAAHDPELLELMDSERVVRWIGEKRHLIAYPISSHTIYNISTTQPDVNFAVGPSETAETLVDWAAASSLELHLGKGAAKEERDRQFEALRQNGGKAARVPDKWADADVQKVVYGVDVVKIAQEQFDEMFNSVYCIE
ncbi:Salicylate 1-monooxygenase [Diplocarpon rosae]|nr:Salicylate 1-monooxygenase [Diplocarpon rosae]